MTTGGEVTSPREWLRDQGVNIDRHGNATLWQVGASRLGDGIGAHLTHDPQAFTERGDVEPVTVNVDQLRHAGAHVSSNLPMFVLPIRTHSRHSAGTTLPAPAPSTRATAPDPSPSADTEPDAPAVFGMERIGIWANQRNWRVETALTPTGEQLCVWDERGRQVMAKDADLETLADQVLKVLASEPRARHRQFRTGDGQVVNVFDSQGHTTRRDDGGRGPELPPSPIEPQPSDGTHTTPDHEPERRSLGRLIELQQRAEREGWAVDHQDHDGMHAVTVRRAAAAGKVSAQGPDVDEVAGALLERIGTTPERSAVIDTAATVADPPAEMSLSEMVADARRAQEAREQQLVPVPVGAALHDVGGGVKSQFSEAELAAAWAARNGS